MIRRCGIIGLVAALALLAVAPAAIAAEAKSYAHLFIQGRIGDPYDDRAFEGAVVRLTNETDSFETTTDRRGVFRFERLPIGTYEFEIRTLDGRVMRGIQESTAVQPERTRLRVRMGRGAPISLKIESTDVDVAVRVPEPRTRTDRLLKQLGIFVGVAGLLAL